MMFQQANKHYFPFKRAFIERMLVMIDKECEVQHLDIVHQRTWNVFWHISQFISADRGFSDEDVDKIMHSLCTLCYLSDRAVSSNQRQWITLSIVRIINATPKYVHYIAISRILQIR